MIRTLGLILSTALMLHAAPARSYVGYAILSNATQPGTYCHVLDATPDGHRLAGSCQQTVGAPYSLARWTGLSLEFVADPAPLDPSFTWAVSEAGELAGLYAPPLFTSFYGAPGSYSNFPTFEGCTFWPVGISGDGTRVVGAARYPICFPASSAGSVIWDDGSWVVPEPSAGSANAISWDGSTVVGGAPAFRWDEGVVTQLALPVPGENASATGVSPDGSVVVGRFDADPGAGVDPHQALWGPNGFLDLGASGSDPTAVANPDGDGQPIAVVGGGGLLMGLGDDSPTLWTEAFGLETLESRLQWANLPAQNLVSATGLSDDGRYVVGQTQIGAFADESVSFAAIMPQWRNITVGFFGPLRIDGYARLQIITNKAPEPIAAEIEFFGTTGGLFASGTTAAPQSDPFPLFEELGVEQANLEPVSDTLLVWTFEYDGSLDAAVEFTTQYTEPDIDTEPEEITLFHWDPDTTSWIELKRLAIDVTPSVSEVTVEIPAALFIPGERLHVAVGRTLAACADDVDNDLDGGTDWNGFGGLPPDPHCTSAVDGQEANTCGLGPELVLLLPLALALRRRARR